MWGLQIWMSPSCLIYLATIHRDVQATNKINKVRLDSFGVGERFDICLMKPQAHDFYELMGSTSGQVKLNFRTLMHLSKGQIAAEYPSSAATLSK